MAGAILVGSALTTRSAVAGYQRNRQNENENENENENRQNGKTTTALSPEHES